MESFLQDIIALLVRAGPLIVLVVTASETAFFVGLLVPAEATVLVAAFMADLGYFEVEDVLLATLAGGFIGDQLGYVLGRTAGRGAAARGGLLGRLWRRHEARATVLFQRQSILAVSLARFISFVRTLMPWFAGMSGMPWRRFVIYDLIGVTGWGVASVAAGFMAGRSWHVLASALGTASAVVILLIALAMGWAAVRARRRMKSVVRVALTGNIASGKSVVEEVWKRAGAVVIDADELARRAVEPGTDALRLIARKFGSSVIDAEGRLDRGALRQVVFAHEPKRRELESIVHPEVERLRQQEERRVIGAGARIIVHSIPLLFETGLDDAFDVLVLVDAPADVRRDRIVASRGLPPEEADAMIAAQMPADQKRRRSHYVIDNAGSLDELEESAGRVWAEIVARTE